MPRLPIYALYDERTAIPVALVKEYEWCPVIPWLAFNTGLVPPQTPSMILGREEHRRREALERAARILGYKNPLYNVYLEDPGLRVAGVVDILAPRDRGVAEVKITGRKKPQAQELVQLAVYALLAYRNRVPVDTASIVLLAPDRGEYSIYTVDVTGEVLEKAEKRVRRVWETITSPLPPLVEQAPEKCRYCRYRRICPSRRA